MPASMTFRRDPALTAVKKGCQDTINPSVPAPEHTDIRGEVLQPVPRGGRRGIGGGPFNSRVGQQRGSRVPGSAPDYGAETSDYQTLTEAIPCLQ